MIQKFRGILVAIIRQIEWFVEFLNIRKIAIKVIILFQRCVENCDGGFGSGNFAVSLGIAGDSENPTAMIASIPIATSSSGNENPLSLRDRRSWQSRFSKFEIASLRSQ